MRGPCAAYIALRGTNIDNQLNFEADTGPSSFRLDMVETAWSNRLDLGGATLNSLTSYAHSKSSSFINATPLPVTGVAVDSEKNAYFITGNQRIYHLRPGSDRPDLLHEADEPFGTSDITLDESWLYWSERDHGRVMRMRRE